MPKKRSGRGDVLGAIEALDDFGRLVVVDDLAVLERQHAAQQVEHVDGDVAALRGVLRCCLVLVADRLVVGVELERIERRDRPRSSSGGTGARRATRRT